MEAAGDDGQREVNSAEYVAAADGGDCRSSCGCRGRTRAPKRRLSRSRGACGGGGGGSRKKKWWRWCTPLLLLR